MLLHSHVHCKSLASVHEENAFAIFYPGTYTNCLINCGKIQDPLHEIVMSWLLVLINLSLSHDDFAF